MTLRTRLKRLASKTICLSRSVEMYEKDIGEFIEKYYFTDSKHHRHADV
ncbi:IS1 family transposase [Aeromonas caviae]